MVGILVAGMYLVGLVMTAVSIHSMATAPAVSEAESTAAELKKAA